MSTSYDVVVIGSGLGGLASAAKLAKGGLKIRLLEKHTQAGGYATTFFRPPFEFEISLHELSSIGTATNRGPLWYDLETLGITKRVNFIPLPHFYRSLAPGQDLDIRIPTDKEGALSILLERFPHEKKGIQNIFNRFFEIRREIQEIGQSGTSPSVFKAITRYPAVSHAAGVPLAALLYKEITDPLAQLVIGQIWGFFGLPPSEVSLLLYAGAYSSYLTYGANYIEGKSQTLANAFVEIIEEAGGEITLGDGAAKIITGAGQIMGVLTESGEHLQTQKIVANANPITVARDLIGLENLPTEFNARLMGPKPSISSVCIYLGLSADHQSLGLEDQEVFINNTVNLEDQFKATASLATPDSFLLTAYNVADPTFSPKGTSVVVLVALVDGREFVKLNPQHYPQLKQRFADELIEQASVVYPKLSGAIDTLVVSTPITNMRFTQNPYGAIYGFANTPTENPAFRLSQKGPLPGLYFASAWTQPGGGFEPTISSGLAAAELLLAEREQSSVNKTIAVAT